MCPGFVHLGLRPAPLGEPRALSALLETLQVACFGWACALGGFVFSMRAQPTEWEVVFSGLVGSAADLDRAVRGSGPLVVPVSVGGALLTALLMHVQRGLAMVLLAVLGFCLYWLVAHAEPVT